MRSYIQEQKEELEAIGRDVSKLLSMVEETPVAAQILRNFGKIAGERRTGR
jgi:hypothetical protein